MFLHPILPGVGKWLAEFTATSQVKHSSQRIRSSDDVDIATRNRPEADGLYSSEAFAQRAVTVVNAHASEENGQPAGAVETTGFTSTSHCCCEANEDYF